MHNAIRPEESIRATHTPQRNRRRHRRARALAARVTVGPGRRPALARRPRCDRSRARRAADRLDRAGAVMGRLLLVALVAATIAGASASSALATFPGRNGPIAYRPIDPETGFGVPLLRA